jgi:hypothetical protein
MGRTAYRSLSNPPRGFLPQARDWSSQDCSEHTHTLSSVPVSSRVTASRSLRVGCLPHGPTDPTLLSHTIAK